MHDLAAEKAKPPARRAAPMRLTVPDLIGNLAILVALRIGVKVLLVRSSPWFVDELGFDLGFCGVVVWLY